MITLQKIDDSVDSYELLYKWLADPIVNEWYEKDKEITFNYIKDKYQRKVTKDTAFLWPFWICEDNIKVGYIQYYILNDKEKTDWRLESNLNIIGIDLFIGKTNLLSKGIGSKTILIAIEQIRNRFKPDLIVLDVHKNNIRAIKCYENCGFKPANDISDGYRLMKLI